MVLPIDVTRLCPDCDILTECPVCPVCGRDRTFPVATWLSPLKAAGPAASAHPPSRVRRALLHRRPAAELSARRAG
jgi:hypothetical protein